MDSDKRNATHIVAGGVAGTTGAVITCPLEVIKTRLQSSNGILLNHIYHSSNASRHIHLGLRVPAAQFHICSSCSADAGRSVPSVLQTARSRTASILFCLRYILQTEGPRGLFKGLVPNLFGVAPSRAMYFGVYARSKQVLNDVVTPDTPLVHLCSAAVAGSSTATLTNPLWVVKTRIQLDQKTTGRLTYKDCISRIHRLDGMRGFYKGLSASYYGVSETVIHLVIYESVKARLAEAGSHHGDASLTLSDFLKFMLIGAFSKSLATVITYPHDVARTRLREEGNRYKSFFQTLGLVLREEGFPGMYRGLCTQLVRQIPNTAIVMATYELVVHLLTSTPSRVN